MISFAMLPLMLATAAALACAMPSAAAQQASGYLRTGEWGSVVPTCGVQDCIHPGHMEATDMVMVAQATTATLADLYRKAKSRGLVTARTEYAG